MSKMKTRKAAAKRYMPVPSGKVKSKRAGRRHLLRKKNRSRKNDLKGTNYVHPSAVDLVHGCLPYASKC